MAKAIGANLVDMDQIQLLHTCSPKFGTTEDNSAKAKGVSSVLFVNKEGKRFVQEDGRRDKVIVNGNVLHTTMKVLAEDCRYREIKYYADGDFKKWLEQEEPDANKDRYFLFSPKASESR